MALLTSILLGSLLSGSGSAYRLTKTYNSTNFFNEDSFVFQEKFGDQNYVSKAEAEQLGLVNTHNEQVYLGVDYANRETLKGRKTVRVSSVATMDHGLVIADFAHLPNNACGAWSAFWVNRDNGQYSEVDIIENAGLANYDSVTIYSDYPGVQSCNMTNNGGLEDSTNNLNCRYYGDHPPKDKPHGCGVNAKPNTFGTSYNDHNHNEGGIWAAQIESDGIKVWQFDRGTEQPDIHTDKPDPTKWGTPILNFGAGTCDMRAGFKDMKIILNIALCGDMGGSQDYWGRDKQGRPGECLVSTGTDNCEQYVADHPEVFEGVHWLVNSIRTFEHDGGVGKL